jgi:hypothetical protein
MATLNSPGVSVTVVDESFYTPAAPGTVPLIFVASASNKKNASATGTAAGTLAANAGKVWTITSQRDLTDTFGTPVFQTDASNNPVNGGEVNEYGLQAAYSLLGVSSQAYIVRADLDLGQLDAQSSIPTGAPVSGTYWVDTSNTTFGVSQWDAVNAVFVNKTPLVIDNTNKSTVAALSGSDWVPNQSFGTKGSYAMVITSENTNALWFKNTDNVWVEVGSNEEGNFTSSGFTSSAWQTSWPVATSSGFVNVSTASVTISINAITVTLSSDVSVTGVASSINSQMHTHGVGARVVGGVLALYADATATSNGSTPDGKITIANGTTTAVSLGFTASTYGNVALAIQPHTQVPKFATNSNPTGSVYVKTTAPNSGASWSVKYYNGATQTFGTVAAPIYATAEAATYDLDKTGGTKIPAGTLYVESNFDHGTGASTSSVKLAEFKVYRRNAVMPTTISYKVAASFTTFNTGTTSTFQIKETLANSAVYASPVTVSIKPSATLNDFVTAVSAAGLTNVSATYNAFAGTVSLSHALGGDFKLLDGTNSPLTGAGTHGLGFTAYNMTTQVGTLNLYATGLYEADGFKLKASNWKPLVFEAKASAPYTDPADGQLWYSSIVDEVDIMYHNGTTWVGYLTAFPLTDVNGPQVAALAPTTQSDGNVLRNGDIWISTSPIDSYGHNIYVWNGTTLKWVLQDPTDHTTTSGWVFADARWAATGQSADPSTIQALLASNYLDPDAPDPALYPEGTRLWNLRRSGFNVKKYVVGHINVYANNGINVRYTDIMDGAQSTVPYFADRWVSASPNDAHGVGAFGRLAQRGVVVAAFKELIDTNQAIRDTDTLVFNLVACPGYPEAVQNMVAFNTDRGQTAFVVGDTPFRLPSNGTALSAWGNNTNNALDNGDVGAVSYDDYMAFYYPSGYTNDNLGNYIVVPPSHMLLRTIARSDSVSYPWFAPAGLRRGGVDNATSVGYVDSTTSEFVQASLYESLRDVLQGVKVNPIATLQGAGLTVMGQHTRANAASALDRVNVARLVCYLRRQLEILARPFLFEPNDKITRDEIKAAAEGLLLELVGQRALFDFLVVCDESNNTPTRIDRNELWMDIAIEPVKAVEFIYIPLRLVNTGAIAAGRV